MTDIVVTVPQHCWEGWLHEGSLPGDICPPGVEYYWFSRAARPRIEPGERVYVVAFGRLRGYAPLVRIETLDEAVRRWSHKKDLSLPPPASWWWPGATWALVRRGEAVACTIRETITSHPGWCYRFWRRDIDETPFPGWREP